MSLADSSQTEIQAMVRTEQVKLLYHGLITSIPVSLIIAFVTAVILEKIIPSSIVYGWLSILVVVSLMRLALAILFFKNKIPSLNVEHWYQLFFITTTLTALTWGIGVWLMFPAVSIAHQAFLGMIIAGLSAGAISALSSSLIISTVFILLTVSPLWFRFFASDSEFSLALGGLSLLFQIGVLFNARQINKSILQNVKLRHQSNQRELALKQSEERLNESEEKYRRLFELSQDPMWIIQDQRIVLINNAAISTLGYSTEESFLNHHPADFSPPYQDNEEESKSKLNKLMEFATEQGHHHFEWLFQKQNQQELPSSISITGIPLAGQQALFYIWRDISSQKESEQALLKAQKKAEQASETKSQFLATMSHELRTPMNGILGMSELLDDYPLPNEQKEYLNILRKSGKNLMNILNDILDFSTLESGRSELKLSPCNFQINFSEIVNILEPKAQEKRLSLDLHFPDNFPEYLIVDIGKIRQILLNLIGNAIKFTEQGEITISVEQQSIDVNKHTIKVQVKDTGIGIDPDLQDKIFESFTQSDSSSTRAYGGTGLGLAISQKLVHLMKGNIGVNSELGKGSCFWFELPLETSSTAISDINKNVELDAFDISPAVAKQFRKVKILLAEDLYSNQLLVSSIMDFLEIKYDIASNGLVVLEMIKNQQYDLILMDCHMHKMDGYEATRKIRELEGKQKHTPIIALTANAMESDRQKCLTAGMDDFISKPINIMELKDILTVWLDKSKNN